MIIPRQKKLDYGRFLVKSSNNKHYKVGSLKRIPVQSGHKILHQGENRSL